MRRGLSILELTVVTLLTAVMAAIVAPKWAEFQAESQLSSAAFAVSADLQAIRQYARRTGQSFDLTINGGGTTIQIAPPIPSLIGNHSGTVEYAARYPGFTFDHSTFGGISTINVDHRGDFNNSGTYVPASTNPVVINLGGSSISVSL